MNTFYEENEVKRETVTISQALVELIIKAHEREDITKIGIIKLVRSQFGIDLVVAKEITEMFIGQLPYGTSTHIQSIKIEEYKITFELRK